MSSKPNSMLSAQTRDFYQRALLALRASDVPFLVGGAYAFTQYTEIERHTKDFDVFTRAEDAGRALSVLESIGARSEITFPHWLGKAYLEDDYIDVIFSAGNGVARVDDRWFMHAEDAVVFDVPVKLVPAEEMIWSKAFIMERERFDGADIAHVLRARGHQLDWPRLLERFGENWRVLLAHLVLFPFIYPDVRHAVPRDVMDSLIARLQQDSDPRRVGAKLCGGTLLSRQQYLDDLFRLGYRDARLVPVGNMTAEQIARWTEAIEE